MRDRTIEYLRTLSTSIFYTLINPAMVMGLGFLFISGSIRAEQIADWTGLRLISLYGILNYETALQFSTMYHEFLNQYYLIPPLFFAGMAVLFVKRYRQLRKIKSQKQRRNKAISLGVFESFFLAVILFGGVIGNIYAVFPDAISNVAFVLGIVIPAIGLSLFKEKLAENLDKFIDSRGRRKQN